MNSKSVNYEQRILNNKMRRLRIVRRQRRILFLAVLMTIAMIAAMFFKMSVLLKAQSDDYVPTCKYYKVVTVHGGDTLGSLAANYYADGEYDDFASYIDEICHINHLESPDKIIAGENVVLPYYDVYR